MTAVRRTSDISCWRSPHSFQRVRPWVTTKPSKMAMARSARPRGGVEVLRPRSAGVMGGAESAWAMERPSFPSGVLGHERAIAVPYVMPRPSEHRQHPNARRLRKSPTPGAARRLRASGGIRASALDPSPEDGPGPGAAGWGLQAQALAVALASVWAFLTISSWNLAGTFWYLRNSMLKLPLPWVMLRKSLE